MGNAIWRSRAPSQTCISYSPRENLYSNSARQIGNVIYWGGVIPPFRIHVMYEGEIVGIVPPNTPVDDLGLMMAGAKRITN